MNRKQFAVVIIGILALIAEIFTCALNYLDFCNTYGSMTDTPALGIVFWVPYIVFTIAIFVIVISLLVAFRSRRK